MAQWMSTDKYIVQVDSDISLKLREVAESLAKVAYQVACHNDNEVSHYQSGVYKSTHEMLKQAIRAAYPYLDTERIYDTWIDCGESIADCAKNSNLSYSGTCVSPGCTREPDIDPEDGQYNSRCTTCTFMTKAPLIGAKQHVHLAATRDGVVYPTACSMVPIWDDGRHTGWACTGTYNSEPCGYWTPIN